ncbi:MULTISPECIES: hypothetical protein [unclassified Myroides]|uniref:hypothetical protein n=1 Tax=unclassified Myroides TaxID=2642485 RepID=UPI003D2F7C3E
MINKNKYTLLCIGLLLASCSSDDNVKKVETTVETVYHLSHIEHSKFYEEYSEDENFKPEMFFNTSYTFQYDDTFNLQVIDIQQTRYHNTNVIDSTSSQFFYTLDEQGRLETVAFKEGDRLIDQYTYHYEDDLLQTAHYDKLAWDWSFSSTFTYNDKKQCISNKALDYSGLTVDMKYNELNQIDHLKYNGVNYRLTYDDKRTPFYNLPFDLLSDLTDAYFAYPYPYKFPNNITEYKTSNYLSTVVYTYNEADLPIRVVYYNNGLLGREIIYTYEKQEVITPK